MLVFNSLFLVLSFVRAGLQTFAEKIYIMTLNKSKYWDSK